MRLFVKHEPSLRAYARTLLPDWNAVDDAIQEASVTMWEKHGDLDGGEGFLPWGKAIVRFKCLSLISALRGDRHLLSDAVLELLASEGEATEADQHVAARGALRTCLGDFTDLHREVLLSPYSEDGVVGLAKSRDKTANSLYKLLGRLRDKLATCVRRRVSLEAS